MNEFVELDFVELPFSEQVLPEFLDVGYFSSISYRQKGLDIGSEPSNARSRDAPQVPIAFGLLLCDLEFLKARYLQFFFQSSSLVRGVLAIMGTFFMTRSPKGSNNISSIYKFSILNIIITQTLS